MACIEIPISPAEAYSCIKLLYKDVKRIHKVTFMTRQIVIEFINGIHLSIDIYKDIEWRNTNQFPIPEKRYRPLHWFNDHGKACEFSHHYDFRTSQKAILVGLTTDESFIASSDNLLIIFKYGRIEKS